MANWGQTAAEGFSNSFDTGRKLAFQKWQTQQETQAKMFESGFLPADQNDSSPNTTTLFGQKFKFSPQIAAMKMAPWLAMTPGGMGMLNGMAQSTSQDQSNPAGGNVQMPNVQGISMPAVGMPGGIGPTPTMAGGLNNYPAPNYMMGFPGATVDPRYSAGLDVAKESSIKRQGQAIDAGQSVARDTTNFGMMKGIMDELMGTYDNAVKSSVGGDQYHALIGKAQSSGWLGNMNPEGQAAVGQFQAKRNELMTRMQPLLSEQYGKEGSNRIMESLLKLSDKELPNLSDPRATAAGKSIGTMKNFYRFAKASGEYAGKVGLTADAAVNGDNDKLQGMINKVLSSNSGQLSPSESKFFDSLQKQYSGKSVSNAPFQVGGTYNGHKILSIESAD